MPRPLPPSATVQVVGAMWRSFSWKSAPSVLARVARFVPPVTAAVTAGPSREWGGVRPIITGFRVRRQTLGAGHPAAAPKCVGAGHCPRANQSEARCGLAATARLRRMKKYLSGCWSRSSSSSSPASATCGSARWRSATRRSCSTSCSAAGSNRRLPRRWPRNCAWPMASGSRCIPRTCPSPAGRS